MHSTEGLRPETPRRPRIWRIVVIVVLLAAISEPLIMYHMLVLQKEKRQAAAELTLPPTAHLRP